MANYQSTYTGEEIDAGIGKANTALQAVKTINNQTITGEGNIDIEGISGSVKTALLNLLQHVAYTDANGQTYYNALSNALNSASLSSISAVYTQSGTVYTTDSLDSLKSNLVVTATYSDNTTATVSDYTLSGTLTEGTSTITVTYGGKTTTFNVTVTTPSATLSSISAVYTQGQQVVEPTTSLNDLKTNLVVTGTYSDSSTRTIPSTDYTLSGTLTVGTSTVTVTYQTKTTTFNVTVTASSVGWEDGVPYENLTVIENSYAESSTGRIKSYNGWNRTDYVPCAGASTITFSQMPQNSMEPTSNCFYNANKEFISNFQLSRTQSKSIEVPANAAYFIISSEANGLTTCLNGGITPHA